MNLRPRGALTGGAPGRNLPGPSTEVRRLDFSRPQESNGEPALLREWLVTNGLGGYASGTIAGVTTRRYHGLLIAALPAPLGQADQAALRSRQQEFERYAIAAPSTTWSEAATKARYLIQLFAATPDARDPRRQELIAKVLDDLARLSD